jgi:pimeloyl-ACP methyl ester carboxylesterase
LHAAAANARGENGAALIAGVVAWEPPMPWFDWYGSELGDAVRVMPPADAAETFMREVVGERLWSRVPTAVKQQRRAEGTALLADLEASRAESGRPNLSDISVPTVAAYGTSTAAHSRRTAQLVADEVAGAELVVIEGSNHGVHLSHPREFAALVNRVCEEWR